jgi:phenylacetate-CoA ligase
LAAATVPHYRDLFRRAGIDPREIQTAEELERLPIVSKEHLRAEPARFRSESLAEGDAIAFDTTGTSGVSVTVLHDRASLLANIAYAERERVVESRFCGRSFRYRIASIATPADTGRAARAANRRNALLPVGPERHDLDFEGSLEQLAAKIARIRPDVIRGAGSLLEFFFRTVAARGIELQLPRVIVYGSDLMTPTGRAFIEERFGVPVISRYNAVESFKIGFFCEERRGFHLHEDLCHVTIVDPNGRRLPAGARGEVVISNLVNRGTVLLNYRLADLGTITTARCTCGRSSPLLSELEGRVSEIIHLRDGTFVQGVDVWEVTRRWPEVIKYELVQEERDRFRLTLVTDDAESYTRIAPGLGAELRALLHGATVETACLELEASWDFAKFRRVLALPPEETAG